MSKIKTVSKLIDSEKEKLRLLFELRTSLREENSKIIVDNIISNNRYLFIATERKTEKQLISGSEEDVMKFLAKRGYTEIFWRPLKRK